MSRAAALLCLVFALGCAALSRPEAEPKPYRYTATGRVVWQEELEFAPPPEAWRLVQVEEGDEFSFAFLRTCAGPSPCQSTFAYDEEPFGYSRDLDARLPEFFARFLWATRVTFGQPATRKTTGLGGETLEAVAEGRDPVRGEKVRAKVVLAHRGERVVALYLTQWRGADGGYSDEEVADFDRFVESFRWLRPSFYETL